MSDTQKQSKPMSAIKLALLAQKLRNEAQELKYLKNEPIAIIGMSCRFPGGANSPSKYWDLLINKTDAISEIPADRWDINKLYDPEVGAPGKINTRSAAFLDQIDQFDPTFFGISPREARAMDPQQRLFLEVSYEALENAGLTFQDLNNTQTGVFATSYHNDYAYLQHSIPEQIDGHMLTGILHSIVPNRLSYFLNLHGPSISLDTACSSSLVAVHMACQSLHNEECDLALAGGVSLIISPDVMISLSKVGFLAPDGRCRTFDAEASGFSRGEGCGVIILKRLSDALADGDNILAVIRGSAVNQDGYSNVLTAPNGMAQRQVIRQALVNAGVSADQISYIEAHGTGTPLGDPIEVEALAEVLGSRPDSSSNPCVLTSVKTNIGHLEAAAGVAGLIKVVLSLQHEAIPPHLHFNRLNPYISLDGTPFIIPTETFPWPRNHRGRFAGISSFGVGGTNAHVILEEAPRLPVPERPASLKPYLLPLSAHQPEALRALSGEYQNLLSSQPQDALNDICYTASVHRNHHSHRVAVVGQTPQEMVDQIQALAEENSSSVGSDQDEAGTQPKIAFIFSGQGQQWWAMGRELLASEPVFRTAIEECDALFAKHAEWSLLTELTAMEESSRLDQTEIAQPAIFAVQMALTALWRSWGITPDAVVGHSVGEIAAAYASRAISLEDAVRIVFHRGALMQQATGRGKMAAAEIPASEAGAWLANFKDSISIAAINSPTSVVFSGASEQMDLLLSDLSNQGISTKVLPVNYAFHSQQMEKFQAGLAEAVKGLVPARAIIPIYSTVTGEVLSGEELNASYWSRNIREPVNFAGAIDCLIEDGHRVFVEIGAHPVLSDYTGQILKHHKRHGVVLPSIRRKKPELKTILTSLGKLYTLGFSIAWKQVYPSGGRRVDLPSYPWQRKRYWMDFPHRTTAIAPSLAAGRHPLIGERLKSPEIKNTVFESHLSATYPVFLNDHRIFGNVILPATAYLEMALAANTNARGQEPFALQDVIIQEAMPLSDQATQTVQIVLDGDPGNPTSFRIFSLKQDTDQWTLHASGKFQRDQVTSDQPSFSIPALQDQLPELVTAEAHYQGMRAQGNDFGVHFQGVERIYRNKEKTAALTQVQLPEILASEFDPYQIHPALLDACLQGFTNLLLTEPNVYLPISVDRLRVHARPNRRLWSYVKLRHQTHDAGEILTADIWIISETGQLIAEAAGLHLKRATPEMLSKLARGRLAKSQPVGLYEITWIPQPLAVTKSAPNPDRSWLIFADRSGVGTRLADLLKAQGHSSVLVYAGDHLQAIDKNCWEINPVSTHEFPQLLREALPRAEQTWHGVIHLWSLDAPDVQSQETFPEEALSLTTTSTLGLLQALAQTTGNSRLWLATRGGQPIHEQSVALAQAPLWGLGNTVALEHPELACVRIDLDPLPTFDNCSVLLEELLSETRDEDRIGYRGGVRYVARLVEANISSSTTRETSAGENTVQPTQLGNTRPGTFDGLELRPAIRRAPKPGEIEIRVDATGLNFRDVLKTLGVYPGEGGALGDECVGEVVSVGEGVERFKIGDQVLAVAAGSFNTFVNTSAELAIHKPASLSTEEAATIPIAFLTAHYALNHVAQMKPGDRVLIHAAAGGVGLAAVQLAQRAGAEIFGTAGSPEKREYLKAIGVQHVMDSRSLAFAEEIKQITNGQGVHIVLNSLAGDFIPKSISVLSDQGCFLEIGKTNIWGKDQFAALKPNATYAVIYLGEQFDNDQPKIQSMLQELMHEFESGKLSPLSRKVFPLADVKEAFRYMAQAKQIGKIVIKHPQHPAALNMSGPLIRPDATYLVTGGLGGLGLVMARWLAEEGARHIVLLGRSPASEHARQIIQELEKDKGAQIITVQGDVSQLDDAARLLEGIEQSLPPLKGILHAAGIVADGVLLQQDRDHFAQVMAPKVAGTWNLHQLTIHRDLDFFVLFSSIASIFGSTAQGNYAAANAFLDAFAHYRRSLGLPALSINWGAWNDLGMTAALSGRDQLRWARQGIDGIVPEQGMHAIQALLKAASTPQVAAALMRWDTFLTSTTEPFFSEMARKYKVQRNRAQPGSTPSEFLQEFLQAPVTRQQNMLRAYVREQAHRTLGLDSTETLDLNRPLREVGLDSLMAVELRNALSAHLKIDLPATLLFDYPSVISLSNYLSSQIQPKESSAPGKSMPDAALRTGATTALNSADLEKLTDEEAEALLLAELDNKPDKGK